MQNPAEMKHRLMRCMATTPMAIISSVALNQLSRMWGMKVKTANPTLMMDSDTMSPTLTVLVMRLGLFAP